MPALLRDGQKNHIGKLICAIVCSDYCRVTGLCRAAAGPCRAVAGPFRDAAGPCGNGAGLCRDVTGRCWGLWGAPEGLVRAFSRASLWFPADVSPGFYCPSVRIRTRRLH